MAETEGSDENDFLNKSLSVWKDKGFVEKEKFQLLPLDLCTAASLGKDECVKVHIIRGEVDLDKRNHGGWTALMYACFIGHIKIVNLLLDAGVSVNLRNFKGETPLMLAASCGNENAGLLLCHHDLDLEARDERGWTALFHATYSGHQNMVRFLLEHGADMNVVEPSMGMTPFMEAATEGHEIILQLFLQYGVNINSKAFNGDTARSVSLLSGNMKIVSLIDNHVMPIHVVSLRSEADLDLDLSSSDDGGYKTKSSPPKPFRGKPRAGATGGPSIMDGPAAIARLIDRTRSTEPPGKTDTAVPSGYVSFPDKPGTSPLQDDARKLSYRDVTSPINPEDYLLDSSSAGKGVSEAEDDTNAFSKTGALTIKSSSGSSGGLAAALGIRREDSLDSDEFPHDSSCGDSHAHRNSGDASSSSSDGVDDQNITVEQVTEAFSNTCDVNKDIQSHSVEKIEIVISDKGNRKKTRDNLTQAKVNEIKVLKNSVSEWVNSVHDNPTPIPENNLALPLPAGQNNNPDGKIKCPPVTLNDNHTHSKDSQYSSNQNPATPGNDKFMFPTTDTVALNQQSPLNIHSPSAIPNPEFIANSSHINQSPSAEHLPSLQGQNPGQISGTKMYKHGPPKHVDVKRLVHGPSHMDGYGLQPVTDIPPVTSPLVGTMAIKYQMPTPVSALSLLNTNNITTAKLPHNVQIPTEEENISLPSAAILNQTNVENFSNPGTVAPNTGLPKGAGNYGNPGSHGNHQNPAPPNPSPGPCNTADNHSNQQNPAATHPSSVSRDTAGIYGNPSSHGNHQNPGASNPSAVSHDTAGNYVNPGSHGNDHNIPIQAPPGFPVPYNTYQMFPRAAQASSPIVAAPAPQPASPLVRMATPGMESQKETRFSQATSFLDRMSGQHVPDLAALLDQLNLSKYLATFEEQDVDLQVFLSLTDNDLKECGIKLFGPRKKMTNAIARWHSSARPALSEVEQAYADRLEGEVQEMGLQLQTVCEQLEKLKAQVKQEQQLRGVTETCLMEERAAWQYVQRVVMDTRKQCDDFTDVLRKLNLYVEEAKSRIPPDTPEQKRPIRGTGGQPGGSERLSTDAVLRKVDYYIQEVQHLLGGVTVNTDRLLGRNTQSQSPDRAYT